MKPVGSAFLEGRVDRFAALTEAVERFEAVAPVAEWAHEGLAVYPIVRSVLLARAELDLMLGSAPRTSAGFAWRRGAQRLLSLAGIDQGDIHPWSPGDLLVFASRSQLRSEFNRRIDPVLEPWVEEAAALPVRVTRLTVDGPGEPPCDASLKPLIRAAVTTPGTAFDPAALEGFAELRASAFDAAGHDYLDAGALARAVADSARIAARAAHAFRAKRPAGLMMSSYYSPVGWGLCAAARRAGVPAIDVQHGHKGRHHHAYAWRARAPHRGVLPLPTVRFVWRAGSGADASADEIETGAACLRTLAYLAPERIAQLDGAEPSGIIFAAQGPRDAERFAPLVELLRSSMAVAWRSHPILRGPAPPGVLDMSERSLPEALAVAHSVATRYSSTALEAAEVGRPAVFLDPAGPFYLGSQLDNQDWIAVDPADPVAAAEAISAMVSHRTDRSPYTLAEAVARLPSGGSLLKRALDVS